MVNLLCFFFLLIGSWENSVNEWIRGAAGSLNQNWGNCIFTNSLEKLQMEVVLLKLNYLLGISFLSILNWSQILLFKTNNYLVLQTSKDSSPIRTDCRYAKLNSPHPSYLNLTGRRPKTFILCKNYLCNLHDLSWDKSSIRSLIFNQTANSLILIEEKHNDEHNKKQHPTQYNWKRDQTISTQQMGVPEGT